MGKIGNCLDQLYIAPAKTAQDADRQTFGTRLKYAMMIRSVSCKELARRIYASRTTVSGYRTDRRKPDLEQLKMIALVLNVSCDYLLGLTAEPKELFPDN